MKAAEEDAASKGAEGLVEVTRATWDSQARACPSHLMAQHIFICNSFVPEN